MPRWSPWSLSAKPGESTRNSSGMSRWQHSSMKCAPLAEALSSEHAVVGQDADLEALDAREAADQRLAVQWLELLEAAAVDQTRDDLAALRAWRSSALPGRRSPAGRSAAPRAVRVQRRRGASPRWATMLRVMAKAWRVVSRPCGR
jgi:hypothetical protein